MRNIAFVLIIASMSTSALAASVAAPVAPSITVGTPVARATMGDNLMTAAYFSITNSGKTADALVGVRSPAAGNLEIHKTLRANGLMKMREVRKLPVPAGQTIALKPGGSHVMVFDLKTPLKPGDKLPMTLSFAKAGKIDVIADVVARPDRATAHHH